MAHHDRLPARVNITLDVFTNGAAEKKELPMRLLLLGDFSQKEDRVDLAKRERLAITAANYEKALAYYEPKISLRLPSVSNQTIESEAVSLSFKCLNDFKPDAIVNNVPELKRLMTMRKLLCELQAEMINNKQFRRQLKDILQDKAARLSCQKTLEHLSDE